MQGSRVAKVASVGILTVLFLAGMWIAAGSTNPLTPAGNDFSVPTGHFGDRAVYDMTTDMLYPPNGATVESRVFAWTFDGPEIVLDRNAHEHDVVSIQVDTDLDDGYGWPMKSYLDLDTRQVVRYEGDYDAVTGQGILFPYVINTTNVYLGPIGPGYAIMESFRFPAHAQGRTFTVGEDVSDHVGFFGPNPYTDLDFGQTVAVTGPGQIGSTKVWGLEARQWEHDSWLLNGKRVTFQDYENVTFWFSEDSPVPLRFDFEWAEINQAGERGTGRGSAVLRDFESGRQLIPWGFAAPTDAGPAPVEQSRKPFPESGDGWRGDFLLEDAIRSVEADPTLAAFTAWKRENPDARLVGIEGKPGRLIVRNETGGYLQVLQPFGDNMPMWNLRYSAPFGATVMLVSSYQDENGRIINVVPDPDGEPYPPQLRFDPAWIPSTFTVLHEA
ncbi:MAG TPA: hypothetical protein VGB18_02740, partial [Candidatus Thermoplasmatota archaeon]